MNYTPGTWTVGERMGRTTANDARWEVDSDTSLVALCISEADARLVAAAKELLASCKALVSWAGCAIEDAEASERYRQAQAAIAKAESK